MPLPPILVANVVDTTDAAHAPIGSPLIEVLTRSPLGGRSVFLGIHQKIRSFSSNFFFNKLCDNLDLREKLTISLELYCLL